MSNYMKVSAKDLPPERSEELHDSLRHDLTRALIRSIRAEAPEVDLAQIEIVLRPGQTIEDWDVVADCGTCRTCGTCGTCGTCRTSQAQSDVPLKVLRDLNAEPKISVNLRRLNESLSNIARLIEKE